MARAQQAAPRQPQHTFQSMLAFCAQSRSPQTALRIIHNSLDTKCNRRGPNLAIDACTDESGFMLYCCWWSPQHATQAWLLHKLIDDGRNDCSHQELLDPDSTRYVSSHAHATCLRKILCGPAPDILPGYGGAFGSLCLPCCSPANRNPVAQSMKLISWTKSNTAHSAQPEAYRTAREESQSSGSCRSKLHAGRAHLR